MNHTHSNIRHHIAGIILITAFWNCSMGEDMIPRGNSSMLVSGHTFHVDLTGDDSNPGSALQPFLHIAYGVAQLQAGDTLIVHPGDYGQELDIEVLNSGTPSAGITIQAEISGTVELNGTRLPSQLDGGGTGFLLRGKSYITIKGFSMSDFSVAVDIDGDPDSLGPPYANHIEISQCSFTNDGEVGVQVWKADDVTINRSLFVGEIPPGGWPDPANPAAIQDYGVNFYYSTGSLVEESTFFGAHNQALSFKEGCASCVVRRNVFEGALYTAIYLGQNKRVDGRPACTGLTAEYNIVRGASGYRVKSPLRCDNVDGATVRYNYFESFDETNNTSGIHVFDEALGTLLLTDNIIVFGQPNDNSGGIALEELASETMVQMENNTIYSVVQDLFGTLDGNDTFSGNISYQCVYQSVGATGNYQGDPGFLHGNPMIKSISVTPGIHPFDHYYHWLVNPFRLVEGSSAEGFGCRFSPSPVPDYNRDDCVDSEDLNHLRSFWLMTSDDPTYDIDGDAMITVIDLVLLSSMQNPTCGIP